MSAVIKVENLCDRIAILKDGNIAFIEEGLLELLTIAKQEKVKVYDLKI